MSDYRLLLGLLAALVPVALFFSLQRRKAPPAQETAPPPQAEDYGLAREAQEPRAGTETAGPADGAAAAAAGGALIIGYEVAKARERAPEAQKDDEKPS